MGWPTAAIVGSSLASAHFGSKAADKASDAARDASKEQIEEWRRQYDLNRTDQLPWMNTGKSALNALAYELGLPGQRRVKTASTSTPNALSYGEWSEANPTREWQKIGHTRRGGDGHWVDVPGTREGYQNYLATLKPETTYSYQDVPNDGGGGFHFESDLSDDPLYQFAKEEGLRAATRHANRVGGSNSGNILAELQDRGTGLGYKYQSDAWNRQFGEWADRMNRLAGTAGIGQTAVNQIGNAGMGVAAGIGSSYGNRAAIDANAQYTKGHAYNNAAQGGLSNYLTYDYLNRNPGAWWRPDPYSRGPR